MPPEAVRTITSMDTTMTCARCGSVGLEEGFIDDGASGRVAWFQGERKVGMFGTPKRSGPQRPVLAYQCPQCSHLELFTGPSDWVAER